jgi:hypothetical protein
VKTTIGVADNAADNNTESAQLVRRREIEGKDVSELRDLAMKHIRLRLNELEKERSSMTKVMRPMALALIDFVSIPEARVIAAENLDTWLQNPSMKGPAKELLTKVVAVRFALVLWRGLLALTDRLPIAGLHDHGIPRSPHGRSSTQAQA